MLMNYLKRPGLLHSYPALLPWMIRWNWKNSGAGEVVAEMDIEKMCVTGSLKERV